VGWGVLTVESQTTRRRRTTKAGRRSSFGCHVAHSNVAPGLCMREVSGGGGGELAHLGSLSSAWFMHADRRL